MFLCRRTYTKEAHKTTQSLLKIRKQNNLTAMQLIRIHLWSCSYGFLFLSYKLTWNKLFMGYFLFCNSLEDLLTYAICFDAEWYNNERVGNIQNNVEVVMPVCMASYMMAGYEHAHHVFWRLMCAHKRLYTIKYLGFQLWWLYKRAKFCPSPLVFLEFFCQGDGVSPIKLPSMDFRASDFRPLSSVGLPSTSVHILLSIGLQSLDFRPLNCCPVYCRPVPCYPVDLTSCAHVLPPRRLVPHVLL
jgi:hypothetical protein